MSRDGNGDLFSTSVDKLFGGADRIRFVSLSPPKLASIGGHMGLVSQVQWETRETVPVHLAPTPVLLAPRVHIGWDQWPERIMCIATHTRATGDAWTHAVEQVPLGISGAVALWVPLGATMTPWETMVLSNYTVVGPYRRAEKPLMLAL